MKTLHSAPKSAGPCIDCSWYVISLIVGCSNIAHYQACSHQLKTGRTQIKDSRPMDSLRHTPSLATTSFLRTMSSHEQDLPGNTLLRRRLGFGRFTEREFLANRND